MDLVALLHYSLSSATLKQQNILRCQELKEKLLEK